MDIVDRIDLLAKKKGWPRSEAFRRVGLNPVAAADWRKGKSSPEKHIAAFAQVLDTTEAYLRGETDDSSPSAHPSGEEKIEILARAARKMTEEEKDKLIEMAKVLFRKAFDDTEK